MNIDKYEELIPVLAAGESCRVNGCYLSPDIDDGLIWGTDFYGCDFIAASGFTLGDSAAARKAIESAYKAGEGLNAHDAHFQPELYSEALQRFS